MLPGFKARRIARVRRVFYDEVEIFLWAVEVIDQRDFLKVCKENAGTLFS